MPGPGGFMPPKHAVAEKNKEPLPKNIKEVPRFLGRLVSTFCVRLLYIYKLLWETSPFILISLVVTAVVMGLLPMAASYVGAQIINKLAESLSGVDVTLAAIGVLLALSFAISFFQRLISDINGTITKIAGGLITKHIKLKIIKKANTVDISYFDLPDFYEKLENADREAGMRPLQVLNASLSTLSAVISIVSFIVVLVGISTWAPIIVAIVSLPSTVVSFVFRKKTADYMRLRSIARRKMNYFSSLTVNKDLVKEIRLLELGDEFEKRYNNAFDEYFIGLKRLIIKEGIWDISLNLAKTAVNCVLFVFVALLVLENKIKIGDYSFYTGALNQVSSGIATIVGSVSTIYEGTLFIDNLISFMKVKPNISADREGIEPEHGIGHKIEFVNVGFKYPGTEKFVLKNLSFTLEPGASVSLVGLNGAGKTTIIKLLTRLYDPNEGKILLDGRDIKEYKLSSLYKMFGIIFQDFGRYAVTIKENILFGDVEKEADDAAIEKASIQSNAIGYIDKLPRRFDTPLTRIFEEDGLELSGGMWQKLAVARAFYGDSEILILDEPTASLDALAEQEIFNQFNSLRKGKTTVFVSHRLSSAVDATKILVLENGKIIEEGNHGELMRMNGKYAELFSVQAEKYIKKY